MKNSISKKELEAILVANKKTNFQVTESIDFAQNENLSETILFLDSIELLIISDNRLEINLKELVVPELVGNIESINGIEQIVLLEYSSNNWLKELNKDVDAIIKTL